MTDKIGQVEWEMRNLPGLLPKMRTDLGVSGVAGVTFTVGASDTGTVGIQLLDAAGSNLDGVGIVQGYLADAATGLAPTSDEPSGGIAIGTDGVLLEIGTTGLFTLISEDDGHIDVVLTEAGADTWYLVIVLPNGTITVSTVITFTA